MQTVSVLLAVHNGAPFIGEAIQSVIAQTHPHWELVVVSNGSSDDTVRIVEDAAARDSRIRCFSIPTKNKNAAYNYAFAQSRGDAICFFAADDVLPRASLAERLRVLDGLPESSFSTCCLQTISSDAKYDGLVFPKDTSQPNFSGGSLLFPRSLGARAFPLPEGQPNEDTWTQLHLRSFGHHVHIPRALYFYRIHSLNSYGYGLSFEEKRAKYLQRMHAYELFYAKFGNQPIPFVERHVEPFVRGLRAARDKNVWKIITAPGLDPGTRVLLTFYCSSTLYAIRHKFFRALSVGVTR
jgi:glycosyltransferase involved in cell wall biosynthesis